MSANWEWKEHFIYLGVLRESGITNMFGSAPYLMEEFNLDKRAARGVLINWMENYDEISEELGE